jgi:hypothetical protein
LVEGFTITATGWNYLSKSGDPAGGTVNVASTPDPNVPGKYLDLSLDDSLGKTRSVWADFSQDKARLIMGPAPVASSVELHYQRLDRLPAATAYTAMPAGVFHRVDGPGGGAGPIGNVALVNAKTTRCYGTVDAPSCPLESIDWNGYDPNQNGVNLYSGWFAGTTLIAGKLNGNKLVVDRAWTTVGGLSAPTNILDQHGDGPPVFGLFDGGGSTAFLTNAPTTVCTADHTAHASCAWTAFDFTNAGLSPAQQSQVTAAWGAAPGNILAHGSLDASGKLITDLVWIDPQY